MEIPDSTTSMFTENYFVLLHDFLGHLKASQCPVGLFYTPDMGSAYFSGGETCLYFRQMIPQMIWIVHKTALLSLFWIIFQGFRNYLGISFNKALKELYFRPHCSIFHLLCPNSVRNSAVKQVETKAARSQSVTFGLSFISVCFSVFQRVSMKVVALWK